MVVAVYEKDINLHLQVEINIPKHIFAFEQQNYFRYLSYQPRLSDNHQNLNSPSFQEIFIDGLSLIFQGITLLLYMKILLHEDYEDYEYFHYVKYVQIRSFFWSVFSCIQENADQKILLIWTLFM